MRLGENATKDAVAAKDGYQKLKNIVSAKKAKLRKKAAKDATIDLDTDLVSSTRSSPTTSKGTGARRARPPGCQT